MNYKIYESMEKNNGLGFFSKINLRADKNSNSVEPKLIDRIDGNPYFEKNREKNYRLDIDELNQFSKAMEKARREQEVIETAPAPVTSTPVVVTQASIVTEASAPEPSTPITTPLIPVSNTPDTKNEIFTTQNILIGMGVLLVIYLVKKKKK